MFIYDIARGRLQQLTFDGGTVPLWTPDGTKVTFLSGDALWNIASDFSGTPELLSDASEEFGIAGPYSWSPDERVLFWDGRGGVTQLTVLPDGEVEHGPLLVEPYGERDATFSPDGKWFAYNTNETGRYEIYVQPYPAGSGAKRRITEEGGQFPVWAREGPELFFLNQGQLWAVEVRTEPTLTWDDPVPLFQAPWAMTAGAFVNYDVTADGQRFVVLTAAAGQDTAGEPPRPQIHVVLNWFEELKALVPLP